MDWEIRPEPADKDVKAALLAAVERELAADGESAWWRSGFEDLDGRLAPEQSWRDPGVVEP